MTTESGEAPLFRSLSDGEAREVLSRHSMGRIAYSWRDRVDIEPLHFVADGDWLYGRTAPGTKLSLLAHQPWCAFEVDEVRGMFDWTSVVVKGAFYVLDATSNEHERALSLLRQLVPHTGQAGDPTPHRTIVFRIHISEISGRSANGHSA